MRELSDEEIKRRRRGKNIAVALALLGLVVLFYLITMVKLKGNVS
ncbi:MAG TPA: hypothetical protein VM684_03815 [Gaiellales bacterium]|nr:hypothetical protein [Gaiellales bacterium]